MLRTRSRMILVAAALVMAASGGFAAAKADYGPGWKAPADPPAPTVQVRAEKRLDVAPAPEALCLQAVTAVSRDAAAPDFASVACVIQSPAPTRPREKPRI